MVPTAPRMPHPRPVEALQTVAVMQAAWPEVVLEAPLELHLRAAAPHLRAAEAG